VKISAFCKVTTCCPQGGYKSPLTLVFTTALKLGKQHGGNMLLDSSKASLGLPKTVMRPKNWFGQ
jgi:hypothetical protein